MSSTPNRCPRCNGPTTTEIRAALTTTAHDGINRGFVLGLAYGVILTALTIAVVAGLWGL